MVRFACSYPRAVSTKQSEVKSQCCVMSSTSVTITIDLHLSNWSSKFSQAAARKAAASFTSSHVKTDTIERARVSAQTNSSSHPLATEVITCVLKLWRLHSPTMSRSDHRGRTTPALRLLPTEQYIRHTDTNVPYPETQHHKFRQSLRTCWSEISGSSLPRLCCTLRSPILPQAVRNHRDRELRAG